MSNVVIKRDGTQVPFQTEEIVKAMQEVIKPLKLEDPFIPVFKIIKNFEMKLPDQVTTEEIDSLLLKAMEGLITEDPLYDKIAVAQLAKMISKNVNKRFNTFKEYIAWAVDQELLRKEMLEYDLDRLEWEMDHSRDHIFNFFGIATFEKKYQLRDYDQKLLEKIQWTWMRMAMGIAFVEPEGNRNEFALDIYHQISQLKYLHSHSYNAGSPRSQMSSCFISVVDDSMEDIMEKATELAQLSKFEGGMGISFTKLRASGSLIKKINQLSSGPIPFIKIYDTIKSAMLQGTGKKRSALVFYMEPRHFNIYEFLDLKETNGNHYLRTHSCNTALWIPDEFMKRVENDDDWYLFDPKETFELTETWGEEFEKHYAAYAEKADKGELKLVKKVKARDLYRQIMIRIAKTGNYWMNFKDAHNRHNQAPNYSMIHSSNLCTEISIANHPKSTAVCTLASVNLARFYKAPTDKATADMSIEDKVKECIDWDELAKTVGIAIQALDNVVEFNFYPYPDAERNSHDLRPLGLGIMGFASLLIHLHISYDSKEATIIADKLGEFMYAKALEKSKELAKVRGPFRDYPEREYPYEERRNILLLAIAPTASISLLAGVSSGIDSHFAMVYSREIQFGKFTVVVSELIEELKRLGIWNEDIKNRIVAAGGSIQDIEELDGVIDKEIFKTAYEYSATAQVDIAAAWQKHVDQAISRNLYVQEEYRENIGDFYMYAWKQKLKATYYCFIQKNIQGEKYTQTINKRGARGGFGSKAAKVTATATAAAGGLKRGFGGNAPQGEANDLSSIDLANVTAEDKLQIEAKIRAEKGDEYVEKLKTGKLYEGSCPVDPFEAVMCEGCQ